MDMPMAIFFFGSGPSNRHCLQGGWCPMGRCRAAAGPRRVLGPVPRGGRRTINPEGTGPRGGAGRGVFAWYFSSRTPTSQATATQWVVGGCCLVVDEETSNEQQQRH